MPRRCDSVAEFSAVVVLESALAAKVLRAAIEKLVGCKRGGVRGRLLGAPLWPAFIKHSVLKTL